MTAVSSTLTATWALTHVGGIDKGFELTTTGVTANDLNFLNFTNVLTGSGILAGGSIYLTGGGTNNTFQFSANPVGAGFSFGVNAGQALQITANQQLVLSNYGTNIYGAAATFALGVDVNGNVVEIPVGGSKDYVSNVILNGTDLEFTGVGLAFNSSVGLSSLIGDNRNRSRTVAAGGTTAIITDDVLYITGITAAGDTITLDSTVSTNKKFTIIDVNGNASNSDPIQLVPSSGTISGEAQIDMNTAYESKQVIFDGTNWFVI